MNSLRNLQNLSLACAAFVGLASGQNQPVTVNVDANANRHPINPNIYGFSIASGNDLSVTNYVLNRLGGNATSMYNWQLNATNHASDWYFESILDQPQTPGYDGDNWIALTRAANVGAQPLLTIPMINYIASLGPNGTSRWSFAVSRYGAQTGTDPYNSDAGNGVSAATGKDITGNDPLDANTPNSVPIQKQWIQHLMNRWGASSNGGLKYYIMDNEYSLWNSTHRDVHPNPATYDEVYTAFVNYAGAVRALDPNAVILGFEEWGWWAQFLSGLDQKSGTGSAGPDYNSHNRTYYYPWLLQQLYAQQQRTGQQLLNVLTVHYYPQDGSGGNDDSPAAQLIRNQSTRALWDPNYVDQSWMAQVGINGGKVNLIPTLKNWVDLYYPGLQTGITEYNWGDEGNLNGATAQADVLGIFGREGLDLATRWTVPLNPSPTYLAMQIYRDYDGNRSTFGDTSVAAGVPDPDKLSAFAAVRAADGALTVMVINKQQGSTPVTLKLANFGVAGQASRYQIASASQTSISPLAALSITNDAIATTVPPQSITLFVIPQGSLTAPNPPSGLLARPGNARINLTWTASSGAVSYKIYRGASAGGEGAAPIASSVKTTTFTNTGLSDGVRYFYKVAAVNAAGSSALSKETSAVPRAAARSATR